MRYTIDISRKVKIWVNEELEFDFDGSESEVRELLLKHGGNIHTVKEFGDIMYHDHEYLIETEEHIQPDRPNETHVIRDLDF